MLNSARLLIASAAAGTLVTLASAPAMAYDHALWANFFVDNATVNDYGTECTLDWVTIEGNTQGACFFTLMLSKAQGYAPQDIKTIFGTYFSPPSSHYYLVIGAGTHFTQITTAQGILPGDVLVINKVVSPAYGGHTAIVNGPVAEITHQINPIYAGTRQWKVPVIDSSSTAHGCTDERFSGMCDPLSGVVTPGAGRGNMRVYSDLTGNLLGYTWSITSSATSYYSPSTRPYRVGRLMGLPPPAPPPPPPPPPPPVAE